MADMHYIYYPWTPRAWHVLTAARQEAGRLHHACIEPEHLLMAILKMDDSTAHTLINRLRADTSKLGLMVEEIINGFSKSLTCQDEIPYSAETHNVLDIALNEAKAMHHTYAGTEHLLLGLLLESKSKASQLLKTLGFQLSRLRQDFHAVLREPAMQNIAAKELDRITAQYLDKHLLIPKPKDDEYS